MEALRIAVFAIGAVAMLAGTVLMLKVFLGMPHQALEDAARRGPAVERRVRLSFLPSITWLLVLGALTVVFAIAKPFGENSGFIPPLAGMAICALGILVIGAIGAARGIRSRDAERRS